MLRKVLDWLMVFGRCNHRGEDGLTSWEPYFYGRVYGQDDLFVVIDVCTRCGATLARVP